LLVTEEKDRVQFTVNEDLADVLKKDVSWVYTPPKKYYIIVKRVIDIVCSILTLIILLPFFLFVAIAVFINDPKGCPFFSQVRVGKDGKEFRMYKFRTMCMDAEEQLDKLQVQNEMNGPVFKIKDDPRVLKIGRFLRATSIDEFPQLINIIKGDMSIVGPRPALPYEVENYSETDRVRLLAQPGLTCYWQIQPNRNTIPFEEWMELDRKYITERSILVDIKIIVSTFSTIFKMQGW